MNIKKVKRKMYKEIQANNYDEITFKIQGRLGNSFFQYFCYLAVCMQNQRKYIEKNLYEINDIHFNTSPLSIKILDPNAYEYRPIVINAKHVELKGFFQSYRYFDAYRQRIFEVIKIRNPRIPKSDIALHIRQGDYFKVRWGIILSVQYYLDALKLITSKYDRNLTCNIFYEKKGDTIGEYINQLIKNFPNIKFNHNINDNPINEIIMMGDAENIIIANSSFSWMGAYLGEVKNVYCPEYWMGYKRMEINYKDLYLPEWNVIEDTGKFNALKHIKKYFYA